MVAGGWTPLLHSNKLSEGDEIEQFSMVYLDAEELIKLA